MSINFSMGKDNMASQQQSSNTPLSLRDRLRTPQYVFDWIDGTYKFNIDLAADVISSKCMLHFDEAMDGLKQDWHTLGDTGWCNPPYSNVKPWLEKAYAESLLGFATVFLLPTPNGEDAYREYIFGKAHEIIFINGRLSFIAPEDFTVKGKKGKPDKHIEIGDEISGNTRGSCFVVFNPFSEDSVTRLSWVNRDEMKNA